MNAKFEFQTKGLQLYWKVTPVYALFVEHRQTATSEISSKNQNISTSRSFRISVFNNFALITGKHLCQSPFLIKFGAWIIEPLLLFTPVLCFHLKNHTQNNPLIWKHVKYLVKEHLNVRISNTMFHFLFRKAFETYQAYYTILLIYRFWIHFYSQS